MRVGDLFEWRAAGDCWVRYQVTEAHPGPAPNVPRKLLAIRPYAYAATGCSGTFATTGNRATGAAASGAATSTRAFTWSPAPIQTGSITTLIQYGPFLLAPRGWSGALPARDTVEPIPTPWPPVPMPDPDLGLDWTGQLVDGDAGLEGSYSHVSGGSLLVHISRLRAWPLAIDIIGGADDAVINEYRIIDGHPARISYDRVLRNPFNVSILIYDAANGVVYTVIADAPHGYDRAALIAQAGRDTGSQRTTREALIAFARQLPLPADGSSEDDPTPVPSPTAPSTAGSVEPPATPSPPPCRIVACIEPAPGDVEHKIWAPDESKDKNDYFQILFWSVHTWVTEGYRPVAPPYSALAGWYPISFDDRWVLFEWLALGETNPWIDDQPFALLHDRESGMTWRWPGDLLWAHGLSGEHILFQEHPDGEPAQLGNTHFALVTPSLDVVARFATAIGDPPAVIDPLQDIQTALVAPDGGTVALLLATDRFPDRVQLVDVATGDTTLFFEPEPREGYYARVGISEWRDGQQFAVTTTYSHREWKHPPTSHTKIFDWSGTELVDGSCPGQLSPDGRHVARQEGSAIAVKHAGGVQPVQPWASVVIADALSCEPILRVRSAYASQSGWTGRWLPTGEGFVVGVTPHPETGRDFALVRVRPSPALIDLPRSPVPPPYRPHHRLGPWFAPVGGDRYFARQHVGVYDAHLQRWMRPITEDFRPVGWTSNGEVVQSAAPFDPYEGGLVWLLVQPTLEFPPFSEDLTFRVVGAGACVELRSASGDTACLADGTPVTYAGGERVTHIDGEFTDQDGGLDSDPEGLLLWVRTDGGLEGWIRTERLAWR